MAKKNTKHSDQHREARQSYEVVGIETLTPHPSNPRKGDISKIQESISENGFYGAVIVQKRTNRIIAGEHRWKAAVANGEITIPVIILDVDDEVALRILLADNRTQDIADYDFSALAEILKSIGQENLLGTGYVAADYDALIAAATLENGLPPESESLYKGMPVFRSEDGVYRQILVTFATEEDVSEFQKVIQQDFSSSAKSIWFPKKVDYDSINHSVK